MSPGTKKVILIAIVAFLLFFLITRPTESADVVHGSLGGLRDGAESIVTFFGSLFSGPVDSVSDGMIMQDGVVIN